MPYANNDGVRIYYEREGSGSPLVLHAGFVQPLSEWQDYGGYVNALKADYDVIRIDSRGHGASDKPHDPAAYADDRMVADALAVLDHAGVARAIFWGYSMGGRIGFAAARAAPGRFRAFIIVATQPGYYDPAPLREQAATLRDGGMVGYVAQAERRVGPLPPAYRDRLLDNDAAAFAACVLAFCEPPPYPATLGDIGVPLLLVVGDRDETGAHDLAVSAAAGQGHVTFVSLPGFTHFESFYRSDVVLPHVRAFLADVGA